MNYERLFQGLAVVLGAAAGFFLYRGQMEAAFVSGVLGAVSFLLSIRFQIKERINERDALEYEDEDEEFDSSQE